MLGTEKVRPLVHCDGVIELVDGHIDKAPRREDCRIVDQNGNCPEFLLRLCERRRDFVDIAQITPDWQSCTTGSPDGACGLLRPVDVYVN